MASRSKPNHRGADKRVGRHRAISRSDQESAEHQALMPSRFCAICFLTFGSQERRILWGGKVAHPGCVRRASRSEAA